MAEGDTILRAARRIEAALEGGAVEVGAPNPRGRAARIERLDGRAFERAGAHGKHLLLHFGELVLHSHLGMSGSWHTYRRGEPWYKPAGAAWAVLSTERAEAVQFGGPTLRLLRAEALHRDPILARLGPDILAADFDPERIAQSLSGVPDRSLGDALLDQHLVAGIGNIFKSEACFAGRIDPWQLVRDVPDEQLRHVAQAAHDLMHAAVENGRQDRAVYKRAGPLPPLRHPNPLSRPGRRQPHHLLVSELPSRSPGAHRLALNPFADLDRGYPRPMTIAAAIFLIAVGAILKFATNVHVQGISIDTVGLILMIAGGAGLILGFLQEAIWSDRARRREAVVPEERPAAPPEERRDLPPRY